MKFVKLSLQNWLEAETNWAYIYSYPESLELPLAHGIPEAALELQRECLSHEKKILSLRVNPNKRTTHPFESSKCD